MIESMIDRIRRDNDLKLIEAALRLPRSNEDPKRGLPDETRAAFLDMHRVLTDYPKMLMLSNSQRRWLNDVLRRAGGARHHHAKMQAAQSKPMRVKEQRYRGPKCFAP